jgi:hypothetical protein
MNNEVSVRVVSRVLIVLVLCAAWQSLVLGGPPLICWKVETGGAQSLPWSDSPRSYDGTRGDYDTAHLAEDVLALLAPEAPVLARMETLRRAALYAARDPKAGDELLSRLVARAENAASGGPGEALGSFDAGYFAEAWNQAGGKGLWSRVLERAGLREDLAQKLGGSTGYDWVQKAIELSGGDAEMEYAAALISWHPLRPEHDGHVARAAAGAAEGSPLAENLLRNFSDRGRSIAELRAVGSGARPAR